MKVYHVQNVATWLGTHSIRIIAKRQLWIIHVELSQNEYDICQPHLHKKPSFQQSLLTAYF